MADNDSRDGKRYTDGKLLAFADRVHASHDTGLAAAFDAPDKTGIPAIQVGASEGKFLEILVRLSGATKIVEVGTLAGYSAIRMARAMPAGGKLWSIEYDERHADIARRNIETAGLTDSIEVVVGSGVDMLPTLEAHGPFDMVFVDADKQNYHRYGRWAREHLRAGGVLIGDNAYLFGDLLEDSERGNAMRTFHEESAAHFDSVCVPTPDGMVVALKR